MFGLFNHPQPVVFCYGSLSKGVAEDSALTYRAASLVGDRRAGVLPGDQLSPGSVVAINCVQCQAQHLP